MLRRSNILTTTALLAVCAAPASAATYEDLHSSAATDGGREVGTVQQPRQDLRSPDARDAAEHRGLYAVGRSDPYVLNRAYGSPDAVDAARELPPAQISAPVVQVRQLPSGGFDWADAGIGAAGMLALFSIAAGSALLITGRRRRRGFRVATH